MKFKQYINNIKIITRLWYLRFLFILTVYSAKATYYDDFKIYNTTHAFRTSYMDKTSRKFGKSESPSEAKH